jgi:DNA-binding PadR family transcriptional regulator
MPTIPSLIMLGLLAERPWTAYELVRYLNRPSMAAAFWDVSERTWYREPARLVEAGLAEAREPDDGSPTTYTITDTGRRALEEASPTENRWVYRNEVAAVLYAVAGGAVEDIDARLEHLRAGVLQGIEGMADEMRRLAASGPTLARRAHVSALLARMCATVMMATHDWAIEAQRQLRRLGPDGDRAEFARNVWREIADDLDAFTEQRRREADESPG